MNFAPFVETTLLRRSFNVAREAVTDEASPQEYNLLPPTVMRTQYFSSTPAKSQPTRKSPMAAWLWILDP